MITKSIKKCFKIGGSHAVTIPADMNPTKYEVICDPEKQICLFLPVEMSEKKKFEYVEHFKTNLPV